MKSAIPSNHLLYAVESERLMLQSHSITLPHREKTIPGPEDRTSTEILRRSHPCLLEECVPVAIQGDGNSLFRAISRGLYGDEDSHLLIRLLTALEIAEHHPYYNTDIKDCLNLLGDAKDIAHASYLDLVQHVCTPGEHMGLLHIFGTSAALCMPIHSYCPPATCRPWFMSRPLSRRVLGRGVKPADPEVTVMWTNTVVPSRMSEFRPNHFVVMRPVSSPKPHRVDLTQEDDLKSSSPLLQHKPVQHRMDMTEEDDLKSSFPLLQHKPEQVDSGTCHEGSLLGNSPSCVSDNVKPSPSVCGRDSDYGGDFGDVDNGYDIERYSGGDDADDMFAPSDVLRAVGGTPLPTDKTMSIRDMIPLLIDTTTLPLAQIPSGVKENVYFLIDNTRNVDRRKENKKCEFWDDCGAWEPNGSSPKSYYNSHNLKNIFLRNGQYCVACQVTKKTTYVPLEPQPSPDKILEVYRYYTALRACPSYRRRITWIINGMDEVPHVACVEYTGSFPGANPHGVRISS